VVASNQELPRPERRVGSPRPYVPRLVLERLATAPEEPWWEVEGSVVFVDISGFTKLSERLAERGKEGAEHVTEAIEACFTSLLAVAYGNGGGLLKFGGDALLLLFDGPEHAARAARSAIWMRRTLRQVGRIDLPGAKLQLRMSVGVHSGRFDFFLVGGSHRELIVTGPAWTRTAQMEHAADAGEILLSPEAAAALPARCVGREKGPGRLLTREPVGQLPVVDVGIGDLLPEGADGCLSVAVRDHVLAGGGAPEHRPVTVAFVHFDGTDGMLARDGREATATALDELVRHVQVAVDEQGVCFLGSDVDADGGKLILTAGAPTVTGNDEERVLLAVRRIVEGGPAVPVRIGVNRGFVFAGDIGPSYRRTYTVMGDAVNLAARLMAKAEPGEIYATADVLDRSNTTFETRELEPFAVKGKAAPVRAWSVGRAVGSRSSEAVSTRRFPLVGRSAEMRTLEEVLAAVRAGQGRLVQLTGEPGIGKTRLMEETRLRARDVMTLHATCEAYTSSTPYVVWRDVLRQALGLGWEDRGEVVLPVLWDRVEAEDPDLLPWIPLIAIPFDVEVAPTLEVEMLAPEFRRSKLHEVVLRFLGGLLSGPARIEVEDAHLMDEASADLLGALVSELEHRPWMVMLTRRGSDDGFVAPEAPQVVRLDLPPLEPAATRKLALEATEQAPIPAHVLGTVVERSAGNPQFLMDIIRSIASGEGSHLPDSVEAAAMAQIDRLAPDDRGLVRRASVLGVSFHPRFLEEMLDEDEARPDEATWDRLSGVFADDGNGYLRFRRAVVRDAAYTGLPFRTRRRLHQIVGARLEREVVEGVEEDPGMLSLHFFLADEHEKAWRYARVAGERAAAVFANVEAARYLGRAVEAGRRLPEVTAGELAAVHEARGDALDLAGEFRRAADAYTVARRLVRDDPVNSARLSLKRSRIEEKLGKYPQALRWVTRGRKLLEGVDGAEAARERAQLGAWYATILQAEGRSSDAVRWAGRAIEEAQAAGEQDALARAYNALDWANLALGRPNGEHWRAALEIHEAEGDLVGQARVLGNLGYSAFYEGRWNEALEFYGRCREAALQTGNLAYAAQAADNIAEILCERGSFKDAEALLRGSLRVWKASEYRYFLGGCLEQLGRVASRTGRFEEALALFDEARAAYLHVGAQEDVVLMDAKVAECRVLMGDGKGALELATLALSRGSALEEAGMSTPLLHRVRGYALTQVGDADGARGAFDESLRIARARSDRYEVALTLHARVRLARLRGGATPADEESEAREILEGLGVMSVPEVPLVDTGDVPRT